LGVDIDLAPVVDRLLPGASARILGDRAAAADPESVARAANDFLHGLREAGVGGCVKHFPGLGRADLDTHKELPRIPEDPREEKLDLAPFLATMEEAGAVMISHAAGEDGEPASLSRGKAHDLLRQRLGFSGAAFSDDLEMGALQAFGSLPERCAGALLAGCDLLFVCSRVSKYEECVGTVERRVPVERQSEAQERLALYARRLAGVKESSRLPDRPLEALIEDIRSLNTSPPLA
jgi:beta-N-acetylhexosaminidase